MNQRDWSDRTRLLAAIDRRMAELFVKRAEILDELADGQANPRTGRKAPRRQVPTYTPPATPLDRERGQKALQALIEKRRREGR